MKIVIDLELSERQKKVVRGAVVTGAVIAALGLGIAIAAPHQWAANDTLAAADLNSLNVVSVQTADGGTTRYSVGATKLCGLTSGNYTGAQVGGYDGAKKVCEATCTSPTAHMCTSDELARTRALGMTIGSGSGNAWYASAVYSAYTNYPSDDCYAWTTASGTVVGAAWSLVTPTMPTVCYCTNSNPIACCD